MSEPLEPPPDDLFALYEGERWARPGVEVDKAQLLARVKAVIGGAGPGSGSGPDSGSGPGTGSETAGAGAGAGAGAALSGGASSMTAALGTKAAIAIAMSSLAIGGVGGAMIDRALGPEREVVREVVHEVVRVEVRDAEEAPAVPPAPPDAPRVEPAPAPEGPITVTPREERALEETARPSTLAAERRLLDAARAARARGRDADAESAIARHRRRFPDGALAEERDVLSIEILVASGRVDEARREADELERRHPDSLYNARIARLIAGAERAPRTSTPEE
jgi:hypothetical protein